jgi:hypothetical protein
VKGIFRYLSILLAFMCLPVMSHSLMEDAGIIHQLLSSGQHFVYGSAAHGGGHYGISLAYFEPDRDWQAQNSFRTTTTIGADSLLAISVAIRWSEPGSFLTSITVLGIMPKRSS